MSEELQELFRKQLWLQEAMQAGVKALMQLDTPDGNVEETQPKHLRVGINMSLIGTQAIVELLIDRGIFTRAEYLIKTNEYLEEYVKSYEYELSKHFGKPVKLGNPFKKVEKNVGNTY